MRKLLSIILTLCMLCSMTVCASAEEANPDVQPVAEQPAPEQTSGDSGAAGTSSEQAPATDPTPDVLVSEQQKLNAAIDKAIDNPGTDGSAVVGFENGITTDVGGAVVEKNENVTIYVGDNDVVISDPAVGSNGTQTQGMQLLKDAEVTIQGVPGSDNENGGSITFDGVSKEGEDGNPKLKYGIQNYSDLTLDGVTIDGTDLSNYNSSQAYKADYENIVISNNNGSLTVQNGADILAAEGDVAFDVYAYTAGTYTDGPEVTIAKDAGIIQGTIDFNGSEGCVETIEDANGTAPSLTIEGGTFKNFLLRIGEAVAGFFEPKQAETENDEAAVAAETGNDSQTTEPKAPITITGGYFSFKDNDINKAVEDHTNLGLTFEDFLADGYVVVKQNDVYVVMTKEAADAQNKPVVDTIPDNAVIYVPEYVEKPAAKPAAPAPAPAQTATVVATAPVAIEVNGTTVELTVAEEDIKVETVAPVATGKAAELKVTLAPAVLAVEGAETADVIEAITASVSVEVKGGDEVAAENFEITLDEKGELNVELTAEYLKTLGKGEHTIILKIGGIEIEFVIVIK